MDDEDYAAIEKKDYMDYFDDISSNVILIIILPFNLSDNNIII